MDIEINLEVIILFIFIYSMGSFIFRKTYKLIY